MIRLLRYLVSRLYFHFLHRPPHFIFKRFHEVSALSQMEQIGLRLQYQRLAREGGPLPALDDVEFSVYSQAGEDGILWYIFSVIGTTNKKVVEIGCGNGIENNSANLVINHGWQGFLFDGSAERTAAATLFYRSIQQTRISPPVVTTAWVRSDTVNQTLLASGATGPVDLFSLDIDGIDYWVWDAITAIDPRVVVVEFNNLWDADVARTVPNDPGFKADYGPHGADFSGATLGAFVKLARRKSYRLVGCQRYGFNAFFVKDGIGGDVLPAVDPKTCLEHPFAVHARTVRHANVKDKTWIDV